MQDTDEQILQDGMSTRTKNKRIKHNPVIEVPLNPEKFGKQKKKQSVSKRATN